MQLRTSAFGHPCLTEHKRSFDFWHCQQGRSKNYHRAIQYKAVQIMRGRVVG